MAAAKMVLKSLTIIIGLLLCNSALAQDSRVDIERMLANGEISRDEADLLQQVQDSVNTSIKFAEAAIPIDVVERQMPIPTSKREFCDARREFENQQHLFLDKNNVPSITNDGGIKLGGGPIGLCWWHSEFSRNAATLAYFEKNDELGREIPKPSSQEATQIMKKILTGKEVIRVPGYPNVRAFTKDFAKELKTVLEKAQVASILKFRFLEGLKGKSKLPADELRARMLDIYSRVHSEKRILYAMVQNPGLRTHSLLFFDAELKNDGIDFSVLDSMFTRARVLRYKFGDREIEALFGGGVPYLMHNNFEKSDGIVAKFCQ